MLYVYIEVDTNEVIQNFEWYDTIDHNGFGTYASVLNEYNWDRFECYSLEHASLADWIKLECRIENVKRRSEMYSPAYPDYFMKYRYNRLSSDLQKDYLIVDKIAHDRAIQYNREIDKRNNKSRPKFYKLRRFINRHSSEINALMLFIIVTLSVLFCIIISYYFLLRFNSP